MAAFCWHISTDYVFDGKKPVPKPYLEDDPVGPLSFYGRTKVEAEPWSPGLDQYIIVRTAWMYGRHGHNFLKTMLRLALSKPAPSLKVVHDQFGSLTWSYRWPEQLAKIIETGGRGIYHATSEGYSSWFEVASYSARYWHRSQPDALHHRRISNPCASPPEFHFGKPPAQSARH